MTTVFWYVTLHSFVDTRRFGDQKYDEIKKKSREISMTFSTSLKVMFNLHSVLSQVDTSTFCVDLQSLIYTYWRVYRRRDGGTWSPNKAFFIYFVKNAEEHVIFASGISNETLSKAKYKGSTLLMRKTVFGYFSEAISSTPIYTFPYSPFMLSHLVVSLSRLSGAFKVFSNRNATIFLVLLVPATCPTRWDGWNMQRT